MDSELHIKIAPSILSADFGRLGQQVAQVTHSGADYIHVDVMDGHFVPNLTMGPLVVEAIRPWTDLPLDVHLMITEPERFVGEFARVGADIITVHAEACNDPHSVVDKIKQTGVKAGVAISPSTPLTIVEEVLPYLDQILVMTVNPGFSGQRFIESTLDKIQRMRTILDQNNLSADLEVDGGINAETAGIAVQAGARVLVAGSAVFAVDSDVAQAIAGIRRAVAGQSGKPSF